MKNSLLRLLACSIALIVVDSVSSAQVKKATHDFSAFDKIEVDYDFNVNVIRSDKDYSVSLTVDDVLMEYVQTYVKNHTLYITIEKKSLPSDIKKLYKGRNSSVPVLNAAVYLPSDLTGISLHEGAVLTVEEEVKGDAIEVTVSDNAQIKKLKVNAEDFSIKSSNKSSADVLVNAYNVKVSSDGNSKLHIEQYSEKIEIEAAGNSDLAIEGETLDAILKSSFSANVSLTGKTNHLDVNANGGSRVDALNLKASECNAVLSMNSRLIEAASDKLHISMNGSSTLVFDGDPVIDIVSIKSASVFRYENYKKQ